MKKKILGIIAAAAIAGAASPAIAAAPSWKLVAGTGQTPIDYAAAHADCDVAAVYGFVTATQSWLIWFDVAPELQFLNDDFIMEPGNGYWVACEGE